MEGTISFLSSIKRMDSMENWKWVKVRLGMDPWIGGGNCYILSHELRIVLSKKGYSLIGDCGLVEDISKGR